MQRSLYTLLLLTINYALHAQQNTVIKITGARFPFAIMQQWIDAYSSTHAGVRFELNKAIPADSADLVIAAHAFRPGELKAQESIIAVTRYAQLPVVNRRRPGLETLQQKGFTQHDLQAIFFDTQNEVHTTTVFHPYKRDQNVCASRSFSENITGIQQNISGTTVTGDDRALTAAVAQDINGISYNNLGLVYNILTRKVADSIAVIPVDINENGLIDENEQHYNTLDDVLDFIEATGGNKIPQENVNVIVNKNRLNKNTISFLQWILTKGQQYNRQYGFIGLTEDGLSQQQSVLNLYSNAKH